MTMAVFVPVIKKTPNELAQMITERESLGHELQRILDEKTNA